MLEREGRGDLGDADAPLTDGRRDQPYIPHLDRERRTKGSFRRADLAFGATASAFVCSAGRQLTNNNLAHEVGTTPHRAGAKGRSECMLKLRHINTAARILTRNFFERPNAGMCTD